MATKASKVPTCPTCGGNLDVYTGDNEHKIGTGHCSRCLKRVPIESEDSSDGGSDDGTATASSEVREGTQESEEVVSAGRTQGRADHDPADRSGRSSEKQTKG